MDTSKNEKHGARNSLPATCVEKATQQMRAQIWRAMTRISPWESGIHTLRREDDKPDVDISGAGVGSDELLWDVKTIVPELLYTFWPPKEQLFSVLTVSEHSSSALLPSGSR